MIVSARVAGMQARWDDEQYYTRTMREARDGGRVEEVIDLALQRARGRPEVVQATYETLRQHHNEERNARPDGSGGHIESSIVESIRQRTSVLGLEARNSLTNRKDDDKIWNLATRVLLSEKYLEEIKRQPTKRYQPLELAKESRVEIDNQINGIMEYDNSRPRYENPPQTSRDFNIPKVSFLYLWTGNAILSFYTLFSAWAVVYVFQPQHQIVNNIHMNNK